MKPGVRHRLGVFERWGNRCYVAGPDCMGRWGETGDNLREFQAAHFISVQVLNRLKSQAGLSVVNHPHSCPAWAKRVMATPLDDLIGDPRNGIPLCFHHHNAFDGTRMKRLVIPPPECVIEFAEAYGLEHLLETNEERRAA